MPALARSAASPLKAYAWIALVLLAVVGAWLVLPFMHGTGSESIRFEEEQDEQSLRTLSLEQSPSSFAPSISLENKTARLGSIPFSASGQGLGRPVSPPGKARSKEAASKDARASGNRSSDAQALSSLASTRASLIAAGPNGAPGGVLSESQGGSNSPDSRAVMPDKAGSMPVGLSGQGMAALQQAAKLSSNALSSKDEQALDEGKKTFDAAFLRARALTSGSSDGAGVSGDVPLNLKDNDPRIQAKNFAPPNIGSVGEIKDKNQQYMQQQFLMMLVSVALGGILGPVFSAAGQALARGLGFNVPTEDSMHRVSRGTGQAH